jgi:hypothetical protein
VETGGEGGIRTLGTGVSPYNGLANSTRPLPIARNQSDTITSDALSRAESGCSASLYAPQYAPRPTALDQCAPPTPAGAVATATASGFSCSWRLGSAGFRLHCAHLERIGPNGLCTNAIASTKPS